jgi:hypothetical protein
VPSAVNTEVPAVFRGLFQLMGQALSWDLLDTVERQLANIRASGRPDSVDPLVWLNQLRSVEGWCRRSLNRLKVTQPRQRGPKPRHGASDNGSANGNGHVPSTRAWNGKTIELKPSGGVSGGTLRQYVVARYGLGSKHEMQLREIEQLLGGP